MTTSAIYKGIVMHARLKPLNHRFKYRVYALFIDLDRIKEATKSSIFSYNKYNFLSFFDRDHGPKDGTSLRQYVNHILGNISLKPPHQIKLLCFPRVLGWVFNPISIYYCYNEDNIIYALIYEVRNTFGEHHSYVAPVKKYECTGKVIRQERRKIFYVSPFISMDMHYKFRVFHPDDEIKFRILEIDSDGHPLLSATFYGIKKPLTTLSLLKIFFQIPLQTVKVVIGIHWEAFKLWWKGASYHRRSEPPKSLSYGDTLETIDVNEIKLD